MHRMRASHIFVISARAWFTHRESSNSFFAVRCPFCSLFALQVSTEVAIGALHQVCARAQPGVIFIDVNVARCARRKLQPVFHSEPSRVVEKCGYKYAATKRSSVSSVSLARDPSLAPYLATYKLLPGNKIVVRFDHFQICVTVWL